MTPLRSSMKPSTIKTRFAFGFLRALKRLRKHRAATSSSSSPKEIFRGYRMVKMAADASMASAVGSRRAWSQAMLRKIRCQAGRRHGSGRRRGSGGGFRRRGGGNKVDKELGFSRTDKLRNLIPGGKTMDLCSLLDESAHYIKCLTTQVQIYRRC